MDSRIYDSTYYDRRASPATRRRVLIIPPLVAAAALVLLGFVVYRNVYLGLVGVGLAVSLAAAMFYLEARDEAPQYRTPVVIDRGDVVALLLGLPSLAVLATGYLANNGTVIFVGFALMVTFFVVMALHDRGRRAPTSPPSPARSSP